MTPSEELKYLARRHQWAFHELVFSEKMIEANRIQASKQYLRALNNGWDEIGLEFGLYRKKEQEAVALINASVKEMYGYLKERLASGLEVLQALRMVIKTQRGKRRKTLHLY